MNDNLESIISEILIMINKLHILVSTSLKKSIGVFEDLDVELAEELMGSTDEIETIHHQVEDTAFGAISKFQLVDEELRKVMAYIETSRGLHSVGRYAYKVMEIVTLSEDLDHFKELVTLPYLAELANTALSISVRSVIEADLSEIDELEKLEAQSDNEATEMFQEIAEYLNKRRDISNIAMLYVIVGRYFERASDQAIKIAESAVYLVKGERKKLGLAYKGVEDISDVLLDI